MGLATFYRGIAVPPQRLDDVVSAIRDGGLNSKSWVWTPDFYRLPSPPDVLLRQMPLPRESLRVGPRIPAVYATADRDTALYYALKHNRTRESTSSILIAFQAPLEEVLVDGRDLLFTAASAVPRSDLRDLLTSVFGKALLPYLDAAWASSDGMNRIAMIDLAIQDPEIVRAHYANSVVFRGRNMIPYRSAFVVPTPVPSSSILFVQPVEGGVPSLEAVDAMGMIEMRGNR